MSICSKQLNPLQRRSMRLFAITLLATAVLFIADHEMPVWSHGSQAWSFAVSALAAVPFLAMMLLIPYYFRQEKDEFVRTLMVRAILWGFALPMVLDTLWGFLWRFWPVDAAMSMLSDMPMLNIDLFCIAAMFALVVQQRRYQ